MNALNEEVLETSINNVNTVMQTNFEDFKRKYKKDWS